MPDLLLPTGAPATLADVRAWLVERGLDVAGKILGGWKPGNAYIVGHQALTSLTGENLGWCFVREEDGRWGWTVADVLGRIGQAESTEAEARRHVEEAAMARGYRWP